MQINTSTTNRRPGSFPLTSVRLSQASPQPLTTQDEDVTCISSQRNTVVATSGISRKEKWQLLLIKSILHLNKPCAVKVENGQETDLQHCHRSLTLLKMACMLHSSPCIINIAKFLFPMGKQDKEQSSVHRKSLRIIWKVSGLDQTPGEFLVSLLTILYYFTLLLQMLTLQEKAY